MRKKAVSPAQRRAFAHEVVGQDLCSQRAAGRILGLARSTFNYRGRPPTPAEEQLRKRLMDQRRFIGKKLGPRTGPQRSRTSVESLVSAYRRTNSD